MKSITAWILSILGLVVLGAVVDLLLSGNRMHKFIRAVFSTVVVLVIVTPLPSLIKNGFKADSFIIDDKIVLDNSYLDYINKSKVGYLEKGLIAALKEEGITGVTVNIEAKTEKNIEITKVTINLKNLVIDYDDKHINKYELISNLVTKFLMVDKEILVINE